MTDLRDPQAIGESLLEMRRRDGLTSMSAFADWLLTKQELRLVSPNPVDHVATRRAELEQRSAKGDKFAQALLDGDSLAEDPVD